MRSNILSLAIAGLFSFSILSCNDTGSGNTAGNDSSNMQNNQQTNDSMNTANSGQGVMVGGAMMVPSKNVVENAMNSNDHTTLVEAVKAAGLVETLSGQGPFTVFAPTNEAFNKLPPGTVQNLLKPEMKNDLAKVLTYHVVPGALKSTDLKEGQELTTVQGEKLTVGMKDGKWWVKDAKGASANIQVADVISSNGVTYVIDGILMPK
jgi:uncharacterized surface protein with fasciclin (FAS1) repeats